MKAVLKINDSERDYPGEIVDLEKLLLFVMEKEISGEELIVEVRVDGDVYSERYGHQARELDLDTVKEVEIATQTRRFLAEEFLKEAPNFFKHIEAGFRVSSQLLKDHQKEERGYEMLARSFETLGSLKSHMDNVRQVLGKNGKGSMMEDFWKRFNRLADRIIASQEQRDSLSIANLIEHQMIPLLTEWRAKF